MRTLVVEDEKHLNRMISEAILDEGTALTPASTVLRRWSFANARNTTLSCSI